MQYQKGDIVWVEIAQRDREKLRHPAIVWDDEFDGKNDFLGIMLTHSSRFRGNVLMNKEHFVEDNEVVFNNTHFVDQLFVKFMDWGPFYKAGKLSTNGIDFISDNLTNTSTISFSDYISI